jgi:hypothetical protein
MLSTAKSARNCRKDHKDKSGLSIFLCIAGRAADIV